MNKVILRNLIGGMRQQRNEGHNAWLLLIQLVYDLNRETAAKELVNSQCSRRSFEVSNYQRNFKMPHIYAEIKLDHDVTAHSNENENKNKKSRVSQILLLFHLRTIFLATFNCKFEKKRIKFWEVVFNSRHFP